MKSKVGINFKFLLSLWSPYFRMNAEQTFFFQISLLIFIFLSLQVTKSIIESTLAQLKRMKTNPFLSFELLLWLYGHQRVTILGTSKQEAYSVIRKNCDRDSWHYSCDQLRPLRPFALKAPFWNIIADIFLRSTCGHMYNSWLQKVIILCKTKINLIIC